MIFFKIMFGSATAVNILLALLISSLFRAPEKKGDLYAVVVL